MKELKNYLVVSKVPVDFVEKESLPLIEFEKENHRLREKNFRLEQENKELKQQLTEKDKEIEKLDKILDSQQRHIDSIEQHFRGRGTKRTGNVILDFKLQIREQVCDEIKREMANLEDIDFTKYITLCNIIDKIEQGDIK